MVVNNAFVMGDTHSNGEGTNAITACECHYVRCLLLTKREWTAFVETGSPRTGHSNAAQSQATHRSFPHHQPLPNE